MASLIYTGGQLYGTTSKGGAHGHGTVFGITTTGAEHVVYSFKGGLDGANPQAPLLRVRGFLYGTTSQGGMAAPSVPGSGTVFRVTTTGVEHVVYSFKNNPDGANPFAGLTYLNGKLYGTTQNGGTDLGTVFSVTLRGSESVIHNFTGAEGSGPVASLTNIGGVLFGTTYGGGPMGGVGIIFALQP
jgi:uncharacterized repeat protein (TIGR03803 family)